MKKEGFNFGLTDYPIFNESHRAELNKKLLEEYEMEEIGQETEELFKFYLNRAMRKIMPYYNKLYETEAIKYDITDQYDISEILDHAGERTESENRDITGTSSQLSESETESNATGESHGDNVNVTSRPSQKQLTIDDIKNGLYASSANYDIDNSNTENTSNSNTNGSSSDNRSEESEMSRNENDSYKDNRTKKGRDKTMTSLIMEFREAIVNIDRMIIEDYEIYKLFYGFYY